MKKVIVTGANGFIGTALVKYLLDHGIEVWAVVCNCDDIPAKSETKLHCIEASFEDYSKLPDLIGRKGFDAFFHLAWDGTWGESFKDYGRQLNNAKYACEALVQAKKLECARFILAGTIVQLEVKKYMISDVDTPRFSCIYGAAKIAAEMMCRTLAYQLGINWNLAVISSVYGVGDRSGMVQNVLFKSFLNGISPKLVEGNNLYDWTYIDDIAAGLAAIGESGKYNKTYYVGHTELRTFKDIVTEARDILAPEVELKFGTYPDTTQMDYSLIDMPALYRDTGFECKTDFKEGILMTAKWLSEQMFVGGGMSL